jgi:hypothetical protein
MFAGLSQTTIAAKLANVKTEPSVSTVRIHLVRPEGLGKRHAIAQANDPKAMANSSPVPSLYMVPGNPTSRLSSQIHHGLVMPEIDQLQQMRVRSNFSTGI